MQIFVGGSTFAIQAQLLNDGAAVDATGYVARAQVHTSDGGTLIAGLNVQWVNPRAGVFNLTYAGDTYEWPAGKARIDVELLDNSGNIAVSTPELFRIDSPPTNVFA